MRRVLAVLIALYTVCSLTGAQAHSPAPALRDPGSAASPRERADYALQLGNLSARQKSPAEAARHYENALALAGPASETGLRAALNLAAMAPEAARSARLQSLSRQLGAMPATEGLADLHLNLGHQAAQLKPADARLAHQHIEQARTLGTLRVQLEADDALASLYENSARHGEALAITQEAIEKSRQMDGALVADLGIALEWRRARLNERLGNNDAALAAYERAVEQLRAVRDDIPIEYDNGRSSYSETIAPLHLGYADLLLARADKEPAQLRRVLDAIEQVRQAELQDYLGDRCVVETIQGGKAAPPPAGVALLYPIIFPDRVELLLETSKGIARRTSRVSSAVLAATSNKLAYALRNGMNDFMAPSRQIYDWLLRPFEAELGQASTLVVVPDGALRLLPFGVLHDGQRHAIEKYAVSTVTGMTMTNSALARTHGVDALVVGVADPGPVVGKLSAQMAGAILQPAAGGLAQSRSLRAMRSVAPSSQLEQLRTSLQLPGVKEEVDALAAVLPGKHLLDAQFTVDHFQRETTASDYRIIHIASHGVFGGSAESSFIMAYDDLLTMNGLQRILKADKFTRAPLELLSLSACETAEGNERAPLGISGAAIRARAKSVLGTLWPLEDKAAQQVMTRFYTGLSKDGLGKAEALRQAQLALIRDPNSAHPFFWGAFILIGNWQ
jgi:CHAT domain-containing protein